MGKQIFKAKSPSQKKIFLSISLIGNLGLLGYFKYANFFISSLTDGLGALGISVPGTTLEIVLPVGISFYTFQSMSYSLDIYFGRLKPTDSLLKFLVFVSAFPQLVAGPIVRAKNLLPQLDRGMASRSSDEGVFYILYGLAKKLLIADMLGHYFVDNVFYAPQHFTSLELIFATYCYAFQIFFDFSAYSDIAIGLGKLFGLELPVNFQFPYSARNPKEFWQKWHITLSSWLRDYLYIPLGGNRVSQMRNAINIMIVMLLGGLWHGANWTFVIWGGLHGLYIVVYKIFGKYIQPSEGRVINALVTFLFFNLICLTWIFFRADNLVLALGMIKGIFAFKPGFSNLPIGFSIFWIGVSVFVHFVLEVKIKSMAKMFTGLPCLVKALVIYGFFAFIASLVEKGVIYQAFIYFQF